MNRPVDGQDILPPGRDYQPRQAAHRVVNSAMVPEDRHKVSFHLSYERGIL